VTFTGDLANLTAQAPQVPREATEFDRRPGPMCWGIPDAIRDVVADDFVSGTSVVGDLGLVAAGRPICRLVRGCRRLRGV
jgi:hypothetical protein